MTEPTVAELERVLIASGAHLLSLTIYLTTWCYDARVKEAWLKQHQIRYTAVDIEQNDDAAQKVKQWNHGNLSVPTLDITLRITEPTSDQLLAALDLAEQVY